MQSILSLFRLVFWIRLLIYGVAVGFCVISAILFPMKMFVWQKTFLLPVLFLKQIHEM